MRLCEKEPDRPYLLISIEKIFGVFHERIKESVILNNVLKEFDAEIVDHEMLFWKIYIIGF